MLDIDRSNEVLERDRRGPDYPMPESRTCSEQESDFWRIDSLRKDKVQLVDDLFVWRLRARLVTIVAVAGWIAALLEFLVFRKHS